MQNTAQNYPDSVESYWTRPVNKDRLILRCFQHHMGC